MIANRLGSFFETPSAVAARVRRGWRPFVKDKVPAQCFGYVVEDADLGGRLVRTGDSISPEGAFHAWVFRASPWNVEFSFDGLTSSEGLDVTLGVVVRVELEARPVDVKLFLGWTDLTDRVTAGDVANRLRSGLRESFARQVESLSVEEAVIELDPTRARELLRESGEELFFEKGLQVRALTSVHVESKDYDALRRGDAQLQVAEERVKQRLRKIELWKKEQLERAKARREVATARTGRARNEVAWEPAEDAEKDGETVPGTTRLIYCAGKDVYALDVADDEPPRRLVSLADGDLGYLRSVRAVSSGADSDGSDGSDGSRRAVVLAGAQQGVYLVDLSAGDAPSIQVFRYPEGVSGGGGTNASFLHEGRLYASHSDIGLVTWSLRVPGSPDVLFDVRGESANGVRGVQKGADGLGYFAAGETVVAFELDGSGRSVETWRGAGSEVTAFAGGFGEVVAGTRDGRLLLWQDPDESPTLLARLGDHPVSAVRPVCRRGEVHYAVSSRAFGVTVYQPGHPGDATFGAPSPVRWVAATPEALFGADQEELSLFVWRWEEQRQPVRTLRIRDKVRDLWAE